MGEGRFFSTDMVSLAGRGFRRHGSGRRSGEIGGWKSEIGNRKSEVGVQFTGRNNGVWRLKEVRDRSAMFWAVSITRSVMAT